MLMFVKRFVLLSLFLPIVTCADERDAYQAGVHYEILPQSVRTADPKKIEVNEVFSYQCGHCYNFQELVDKWVATLPDDVDFQRTHAVWNAPMEVYAKAYYSAVAMGVVNDVHLPVFEAIHLKQQAVRNQQDILKIFVEQGVDEERFTRVFNSFGVNSMVNQGKARTGAYRTQGTPEIVVNGRYRLSSRMSGGLSGMLDVARFLIAKERRVQATAKLKTLSEFAP